MKSRFFFVFLLFTVFLSTSLFAQGSNNDNFLIENTKDSPFYLKVNITGMQIKEDGTVIIPSLKMQGYTIKTSFIESELLEERIDYMNEKEATILLQQTSSSPKIYNLLFINNLLGVNDYKDAIKPVTEPEIISKIALADKYSAEGKYIHALSLYYDAFSINSNENIDEAIQKWKNMLTQIKRGKTIDDTLTDDFEVYEYWLNLLNEFEDFWFEECPVTLTIKDLVKGNIDLEAGTADYNFSLESNWTNKYLELLDALKKGLSIARQDSWKQISINWPKYSCRGEKSLPDRKRYFSAGQFSSDKGYVSYATFNKDEFGIIYSIYTLDGTEICTNQTAFAGNKTNTIKGINRKLVKDIDKGQVTIKIDKIVTRKAPFYYTYVKAGYIIPYWKAPDNVSSSNFVTKDIFNYEHFIVNNPFESCIIDYDYIAINNYINMVNIKDKKIKMLNSEVTQGLYELVTGTNPSSNKDVYNSEKYPVDKVSIYDAICFCNRLSEIYHLEPVYSVDEETNIYKWPVKPFTSWPNDAKITIKQNAKADGFRLPTIDEWRFAANRGTDYVYKSKTDFENSAITSISYYSKRPFMCKSKNPNEFGLYDMFGNVREIVIPSIKDEITLYKDPNVTHWALETSYKVTYLGGCNASLFNTNNFQEDCFYTDSFYNALIETGFRFVKNWKETE